ncbi:MAG: hypothetical protein M1321_03095 [Candidatus Marsarchaeota archaeon]|jgi:hypothetical protein|nr:hypothetical protein [Candidatus Marsarchaeota archaeon]
MKAQFWSFDIMFAIVVFAVSMTILTYVWLTLSSQFSDSYTNGINLMQAQLQELSSGLMLAGSPSNWNSLVNLSGTGAWANLSVGFGGQNGALSYRKILAFYAMSNSDYQESKVPLGVSYDYYILVNGTGYSIAIGRNPSSGNAYAVQTVTEPVMINDQPATLTIDLWTNTTFGIA